MAKKQIDNKKYIESKQQTTPGLYVTAGEVEHSDFDNKNWRELQEDYTKIRNGDSMASTSLNILKYPILKAERRIEKGKNSKKAIEARDYVEEIYSQLIGGFQNLKYHKLLALDYGAIFHEIIVKKGERYKGKLTNKIIKLSPFQNDTIERFYYDEIEEFSGIQHEKRIPDKGTIFVDIEKDQLDWFIFNQEFNNMQGRSIFRPIRLAVESKKNIIIDHGRAIKRGAGIPILEHEGTPSSSDKVIIEKIGRTITALNNPYVAYDRSKMNLRLESLKDQQNVMQFLDFLNKEILYNTLTEFMVAGIGQNGSRAATSEHKTAYELSATYILQLLEENFQVLTNKIIKLSYLANIEQEEYPIFKFAAITQQDLQNVAMNFKTLAESKIINWTEEDQKYVRKMFGLPEEIAKTIIDVEGGEEVTRIKKLHKKELRRSEKEIFELDSAINHFETMQEKAEQEIQKIMSKIMDDINKQIKDIDNIDFEIRFFKEFSDKLMKLYNEGFEKGSSDLIKELSKIKKNKTATTKKENENENKKEKKINRKISKLYKDIENRIKNDLENTNKKVIDKKGGLKKYFDEVKYEFKIIRRDILNDVTGAYIDGRGAEIRKNPNILYEYTPILDDNVCEVCAPLDGYQYTVQELTNRGLNLKSPVNPECLGKGRCRCNWIPIEEI